MKTSHLDQRRSGSVLIVSMLMLAIVGMAVATTYHIAVANSSSVMQASSWQEALYGAEAGADLAIASLNTDTWNGWYKVASATLPKGQPTDTSTPATARPITNQYNFTVPAALAHGGEGNNRLNFYVTIDPAGMPMDQNGNQWLRVRSRGIAYISGPARVSRQKMDDDLRRLSLVYNRFGGPLTAPQATRMVEMVLQPIPASMWTRGLTLAGPLKISGGGFIDSFDSGNPLKSTNSLYDITKRQSHGDVGIVASGNSDLGSAYLYGNLTYSGPPVKNTNNVQGTISTPFNATLPPVLAPTWASGTFSTPPAITSTTTLAAGTKTSPARYKVSSIALSGSNSVTLTANNAGSDNNYVEIWVTGNFTTSGSSFLTQQPGVKVTYYVEGNIALSGGSFNNQSNVASNMTIYGVTPTDGTSRSLSISGSGNFIGVMNAPAFDISASGGASLSGAFVAASLSISGSGGIHFDEALNKNAFGTALTYSIASWFEDNR